MLEPNLEVVDEYVPAVEVCVCVYKWIIQLWI